MQKWEYKFIETTDNHILVPVYKNTTENPAFGLLEKAGLEGWEVINVIGVGLKIVFTLRRPVNV